jgi:beta-galactosidase
VIGTTVRPEAAVVYDWENRWAIDACTGPRHERRDYEPTCVNHYREFWRRSVPVDVIEMNCDFSRYKLLVAPMLYMVKPGFAERVERFVTDGGVFVATYWSGIVNEADLCHAGGFPGPLRKVLGIWSEELDVLHDDESNLVATCQPNAMGLEGQWRAEVFCDLIHIETAETLATYGQDFYAGRPALTVNALGKGRAYYIASRNEADFLSVFYGRLIGQLGLRRALDVDLPEGMTAQLRTDGDRKFIFLMNFNRDPSFLDLGERRFVDLIDGRLVEGQFKVDGYAALVLERQP